MKASLASALSESQAREIAVYLLGNVPGLSPIAQSLHILGIAIVMGSIVMVDLKLLGVAVPSQNVSEMIRRLMPWTWWALLLNAVTGCCSWWRGRTAIFQSGGWMEVLHARSSGRAGIRRVSA